MAVRASKRVLCHAVVAKRMIWLTAAAQANDNELAGPVETDDQKATIAEREHPRRLFGERVDRWHGHQPPMAKAPYELTLSGHAGNQKCAWFAVCVAADEHRPLRTRCEQHPLVPWPGAIELVVATLSNGQSGDAVLAKRAVQMPRRSLRERPERRQRRHDQRRNQRTGNIDVATTRAQQLHVGIPLGRARTIQASSAREEWCHFADYGLISIADAAVLVVTVTTFDTSGPTQLLPPFSESDV